MASSILAGVSIRPIVHPSSRVSPRVKKGQPSRPDKQARDATVPRCLLMRKLFLFFVPDNLE